MARPNRSQERRAELVPVLARTFAELGYRRTTTAELAERCGVAENGLYRLWADKCEMFVAALEHVYVSSEAVWKGLLAEEDDGRSTAERILVHEADHLGEHGLHRIVFAGLSELDDPRIAEALRGLYGRFHRFVRRQVGAHRGPDRSGADTAGPPAAAVAAWGILGLGTVANVGRELGLLSARRRRELLVQGGNALLGRRGR